MQGDIRNFFTPHKGNQITLEKIREERVRRQTLRQDSSLEAAIACLRGDRK